MSDSVQDKYSKASADRQRHVDAILRSQSRKKIVVAGPGTGKTFLFKEILKDKKNSLTLTFVNSLVEDLSLSLCGLSEVRTLHGFARSIISKAGRNARVYPRLSKIIAQDFEFLKGDKIDFDALFHNRDDQSEHIAFYKERKEFYGHYGFTDIIYAATLLLEQQPVRIPAFDQVLVDEFQDFNQLEVSLIDLLASKSPILIAGDDDQSLYFFKSADHTHIRNRYSSSENDYESFNLPYCSRCTRVIVEATNDIVAAAKAEGHLIGRIEKPYIYFEDRKKDADCHLYPKLTHVRCFTTQIPFFVEQTLRQTAEQLKDKFSTLIVAPTKSRCRQIARGLQKRGFRNIQYADQEGLNEPTFFDALTLLAENPRCNLGWRVAAKFFSSPEEMKELVEKTVEAKSDSIRDLLRGDLQRQVKQSLSAFKKVAKNEAIDDDQSDSLSYDLGAVGELVGIEGGVVSGVINLESSGVEASDWRPRHDKPYHEA